MYTSSCRNFVGNAFFFSPVVSEPRKTTQRRSAHQQISVGAGQLHQCAERRHQSAFRQLPRQQTHAIIAGIVERKLPDRDDRSRQFSGVAQGRDAQHVDLRRQVNKKNTLFNSVSKRYSSQVISLIDNHANVRDNGVFYLFSFRASGISHKVERNVLNVSFHVNQYRSVIADLRNEISRLRTKLDEGRSKSSSGGAHSAHTPVNQIRDQIVTTFREQMKLRCAGKLILQKL